MPTTGAGRVGMNAVEMEAVMTTFNNALNKLLAANATIATHGDLLMAALTGAALAAFSEAYGRWKANQALLEGDFTTMKTTTQDVMDNFVMIDTGTAKTLSTF
jgi:uncharacterized protein YukE